MLEKEVKVDQQTLKASKGKYTRVCIEIDLDKPLVPFMWVNNELQALEYEGLHLICFEYEVYGHGVNICPKKVRTKELNIERVNK